MLFSLIENLEKVDLILASASARRFELLQSLGLTFKVVKSNAEESATEKELPGEHVLKNARLKARSVAKNFPDHLVIAADTAVVLKDTILGKPKTKQHAYDMLKLLSARTHQVYTGVCLNFLRRNQEVADFVCTDVSFSHLSDEEIWAYINTGEPFDKAGAYAIQGQGALFVEKINGCFFNVVGFPLNRFYRMLDKFLVHSVL